MLQLVRTYRIDGGFILAIIVTSKSSFFFNFEFLIKTSLFILVRYKRINVNTCPEEPPISNSKTILK